MKAILTEPFVCSRCANCCHFPPDLEKKIPVYPEEATVLETQAAQMGVPLRLLEDFVLPDTKNQKILVARYQLLPDENGVCPFLGGEGCRIYEFRPLACRAYPLSLKMVDAFTREFFIDKMCPVISERAGEIETMAPKDMSALFPAENRWARKLNARETQISLDIRLKAQAGEIFIPEEISTEDLETAIREWDRVDLEPERD